MTKNEMTLKCAKNGLDLINISRVTSYLNECAFLIWPTLYVDWGIKPSLDYNDKWRQVRSKLRPSDDTTRLTMAMPREKIKSYALAWTIQIAT